MKKLLSTAFVLAISSSLAFAGGGWHKVGDFDAGGDGKEAPVNRECSVCLVKATDGGVIINSIVVREGDKKTPIKVEGHLNKGEQREISVGGKKNVSSIRIGDSGHGHYEVYVK